MRLILTAAVFAFVAAGAQAAPAPGQNCIAVGQGVSRVAATVASPADCCTGRLQCAQFLSTTTVVRPAHDEHT